MQIDRVQTFLVSPHSHTAGMIGGKNWLFVKLTTDDGLVGWGECYTQLDRDMAIERHVLELARYVEGQSPFQIKHFTSTVYRDFAGLRGSMDLFCAQAGIEQAMWDLAGKALNTPVYKLLGGACRDRIRVYANGWYGGAGSPEAYAEMAVATVARGFTALKFDPFPGPWRQYVSREGEQAFVANVRAVREAVGPDIDLLIEGHRRLAPMHAIRLAREIAPLGIYWYEEPVPVNNVAALAEVRRAAPMPIVTGETLYSKGDFVPVFEQRAVDIINPDVCSCGGILELKEIAAMAEPYYVAVSPHNYNSTAIGLAATVHAAATMPNFIITEYFENFAATSAEIATNVLLPEQSYIPLPDRPGLGVDLDEAALQEYAYRQYRQRSFPSIHQEL
ncbi:MAG: mandelate racemase/muconate lactonizing enzyme family protein [Anaerolineae bacterium]|jgi:galactonate dehydratase|nr:mandelate racemase/muconate lactonizing enzyme family protein [Chloroflexota bacterium]